jgi:hypothetical protein
VDGGSDRKWFSDQKEPKRKQDDLKGKCTTLERECDQRR